MLFYSDFIVVNPEKEKVDDLGIYLENIAHRLLKYIIIATGILSIFGTLSIFFTFNKKTKKEGTIEIIGKITDNECENEDEENKDVLIEKKNDENENNKNTQDNENKEKVKHTK